MEWRYLKVFKRKFILLILVILLVTASSLTKGKTAVLFSTVTGVLLIAVAIYYIVWIMRTPTKKENDEAL